MPRMVRTNGIPQKAPRGKFRVIGVDTFSNDKEEWLVGDYSSKYYAKKKADKKGGQMTKMHVYDDKGHHIYDTGTC